MKAAKTKKEANEINMAYRKADNERYKHAPDVIGYRVNLSNSHPARNICDDLVGVYPTWFLFVGHNDECKCFVTAELSTEEEFDRYLAAVRNGDGEAFKFEGLVTEVPENFKKWVKENNYFLNAWDSAPLIITDNFTMANIRSLIDGKKPCNR